MRRESLIDELRIVLFEIAGVKMGVDADQVARMITPERAAEENIDIRLFHESISLGAGIVEYRSPYVLIAKEDHGKMGVMIDAPRDIVRVKAGDVRGLPLLFAATVSERIVWGAALIEGEIVMLVDLCRLMRQTARRTT